MAKNTPRARGSILLTTLFFITAVSLVAWAIYRLALSTNQLSQRNEYLSRAKALSDGELELIFFRIKTAMAGGTTANGVPAALADICDLAANPSTPGQSCTPTSDRVPFCVPLQTTTENWTVRRSIVYDFSALGIKNNKTSTYSYFTVKVEVMSANGPTGPIDLRVGRRMNNALNSIFQYNIFAQGDLEFAPGGHVTIKGDIAANGGIYMGATKTPNSDGSLPTLTVGAYVRYLLGQVFETTHLADITKEINAPTFSSPGGQPAQVSTMEQPENLLGGLSAKDIAAKFGVANTFTRDNVPVTNPDYNAMFGTITVDRNNSPDPLELANAENRVYRSVITPPPNAVAAAAVHGADYQAEYPAVSDLSTLASISDDPGVEALRAYNRAGLIITVNADDVSHPTVAMRNADGSLTTVTTDFSTGSATGLMSTTTMYDLREQKDVAITEIDVANLKTVLQGSTYTGFNGLLYVYLGNSNSAHPAAVRLKNGSATPVTGSEHGFSVATNGGLYVKGNYNTVTTDGNPTATDGSNLNPAMLMGDAVTVLSSSWDDTVVTAQPEDSTTVIAAKHTPDQTIDTRIASAEGTTIAAGILTGNVSADSAGAYIYSGGGHNLVRFLERWNNSSVDFYGSIGRLFESTHFTGIFRSPSYSGYHYTYDNPGQRTFTFNESLKRKSPFGTPAVTVYDRGTIFTW